MSIGFCPFFGKISPKKGIFSNLFVHGGGIVLADGFCHQQDLHGYRAGTHGNLNFVAHLYVVAGLYHPAVDADPAIVTSFTTSAP